MSLYAHPQLMPGHGLSLSLLLEDLTAQTPGYTGLRVTTSVMCPSRISDVPKNNTCETLEIEFHYTELMEHCHNCQSIVMMSKMRKTVTLERKELGT